MATKSVGFDLASYVIHYSPLTDRRTYLESQLSSIEPEWITEEDVVPESLPWRHNERVLGVSKRQIAADLGVNARSISSTRRQARLEGCYLRYLSFLGGRFHSHTFGSLPRFKRLPKQILELNAMHIYALFLFLQSGKEWGLVFEDDAVLKPSFFEKLEEISKLRYTRPVWINLNDGADLVRTESDPIPDQNGLFRVKPPTTRCATTYLINRNYVLRLKDLILVHGLPDWLPIDVFYQVANRKLRALSFWSEPSIVIQGSESGKYKSNLGRYRV